MLHILTGASCNNNCIFCMESDRHQRRDHVAAQSTNDLLRMIDGYPNKEEILFTSGEPTLNRDLPLLIGAARDAGFSTIGLISNGRMLSYQAYTRHLISRGLNKVTVSIHGHSAPIHDGLVRAKGAFEQTLAGLEFLGTKASQGRIELHSSTVVVKRNLPHLGEIQRLLSETGVHRQCFNVMMLKGRGREHLRLLMASYADIAEEFRDLASRLNPDEIRRVSVADIPRCVMKGIPVELLGDLEHFEQFEFLGSSGITGISAKAKGAEKGEQEQDSEELSDLRQRATGCPDMRADSDYYLTSRELKDRILRVKRPECSTCRHDRLCPGVWEAYVAHFDWHEFKPVR